MTRMYVKLGPCDGHVERWWSLGSSTPCGRPSGHMGKHRPAPRPDDSFAALVGGVGEPADRRMFRCEGCGLDYYRANTEAERDAETTTYFPDLPNDDLASVCDDCHARLVARFGPYGSPP